MDTGSPSVFLSESGQQSGILGAEDGQNEILLNRIRQVVYRYAPEYHDFRLTAGPAQLFGFAYLGDSQSFNPAFLNQPVTGTDQAVAAGVCFQDGHNLHIRSHVISDFFHVRFNLCQIDCNE